MQPPVRNLVLTSASAPAHPAEVGRQKKEGDDDRGQCYSGKKPGSSPVPVAFAAVAMCHEDTLVSSAAFVPSGTVFAVPVLMENIAQNVGRSRYAGGDGRQPGVRHPLPVSLPGHGSLGLRWPGRACGYSAGDP